MKTFTVQKEVTKPRLEINYDGDIDSPRDDDGNLGYFITVDRNYKSPDDNGGAIHAIVAETGDEATSQEEHIKLITERFNNEMTDKVVAIYPIVKYEHSGLVYSLGTQRGFDYSNNGFYIITKETQKASGVTQIKKRFEKAIEAELSVYNKWANGEVLSFVLYKKDGEVEDSCAGFYNIEDIREHLPKSWAKEELTQYISN